MPADLKRKGSPSLEEDAESNKRRFTETTTTENLPSGQSMEIPEPAEKEAADPDTAHSIPGTLSEDVAQQSSHPEQDDRAARFAALRARNATSRKANHTETLAETRRSAIDPSQLNSLSRKKDIAEHKLLKATLEEGGEDFERKRAWDWTIEESERWDERLALKKARKDANAFAGFAEEAGKVYDRQIAGLEKGEEAIGRKEAYQREKAELIERAVRGGGLEIVETEAGELIAVDRDGTYFSTAAAADSGSFANTPDKAAVDRLVADIRKAEEVRLKKRRERGGNDGINGGDVTFINEKNKQFNMKLARFYDKYTREIRESFERGTAM